MKKTNFLVIITLITLSIFSRSVLAQDSGGDPIYIVQPGENLSSIAKKFGIDIAELISINNISDVNLISAGTELIIPGLEGISGVLSVKPVELGETIPVILKKYQMSTDNLLQLNPITSPSEVYVGTNLVLPVSTIDEASTSNQVISISENSSLFFESILSGQNRWLVALQDSDVVLSYQLPQTPFYFTADTNEQDRSVYSPYIQNIQISPLPITQGHTAAFKIFHSLPVVISGTFDEHELHFYKDESGQFTYALDGIHAMREPGLAELSMRGVLDNGETFEIDQMVLIESGGYVKETLSVESTLIDEDLNKQESARVQEILSMTSDAKYWNGFFRYPVEGSLEAETIGFSSYFGNRRSYNNGEYYGFHGGLDFYVMVAVNPFNIYAAAPGIVLYAGQMDIRGNTVFIDHGQGVVSGYAHMSEFMVEPGQFVDQGDLIGLIGKTGRVTGPHLHWDIWVNGNQIEPFDWVYNQYP